MTPVIASHPIGIGKFVCKYAGYRLTIIIIIIIDHLRMQPEGYVAVSVPFGYGCPYLLPLFKAHFLNLSLDVGKRCEGIRAAAWKVCRTFCTPVCNLIFSDLCVLAPTRC